MSETEKVKTNLEQARKILQELNSIVLAFGKASQEEQVILEKTSKALVEQLTIICEPLDLLIKEIAFEKKEEKEEKKTRQIEKIVTAEGMVYISRADKSRFLEELNISKKELKKAKAKILKKKIPYGFVAIKKPSPLTGFAVSIFGKISSNLAKKALFKSVERDLRKANMPYMLSSYISVMLFVTLIVFLVSLAVALIFGVTLRNIAIAVFFTIIVFFIALSYPASVANAHRKKIETELPFATAHMAAIASSKIAPAKIFSVMATTKEYKAFGAEIRKVVNQMNIYGYDLTTALKNAMKTSPSKKYTELLNGMITTLVAGGNLALYLQEKSKALLLDYRLRHERYTNLVGIYSDIYTAILIAAPLIFMLLLAIISMTGQTFLTMDVTALANFGIVAIAILNIIFLIFLQLTQPEI